MTACSEGRWHQRRRPRPRLPAFAKCLEGELTLGKAIRHPSACFFSAAASHSSVVLCGECASGILLVYRRGSQARETSESRRKEPRPRFAKKAIEPGSISLSQRPPNSLLPLHGSVEAQWHLSKVQRTLRSRGEHFQLVSAPSKASSVRLRVLPRCPI